MLVWRVKILALELVANDHKELEEDVGIIPTYNTKMFLSLWYSLNF